MYYRKLAFEAYPALCAYCGFGIKAVLEVAHLDGNRTNNDVANLAILCPTCHRMHDLDLITTSTIRRTRSRTQKGEAVLDWNKLLKDSGKKAAATRKRKAAARKAAATRILKNT
jgi:5-methylcytosine-specific restriction endonuclease McrA